jgi:hypothetical protein
LCDVDLDLEILELRRLSRDLRMLSDHIESSRARLDALRSHTATLGALAIDLTLMTSGMSRALTDSMLTWRTRDSSALPTLDEPEATLDEHSAEMVAARSDLRRARARLHMLGVLSDGGDLSDPRANTAPTSPRDADWLREGAGGAGTRIFERLRDSLIDLEAPSGIPRRLLAIALPSKPLEAPLDDCCAICISPLDAGESAVELACAHSFHSTCIREACAHRANCPICRRPVPW